jgi:hypothetical protein
MDFLWIFDIFECVSSIFCLKLLLTLNFKNTVLTRTTFRSILYHRMVSSAPKKSIV